MKHLKTILPALAVTVVVAAVLLPFLGQTPFYSKGEPREAVVAVSMINQGNWILPVNNGTDIPYKPPFFHFCIALIALVHGHVCEYVSRLPSALSLIAMLTAMFVFFRNRRGTFVALLSVALTLTAFEVHRAGMNCRVDMMLTAFIVGAMLLFYRWYERGCRSLPWWAIVCMSGAVLTKGPVGAVLPCLVAGIYMLMRGRGLWFTAWRLVVCGLLSFVLPALWYVAAWKQGGDDFIALVMEENFGRMTGTMSYDSHTHPFTYNFTSLLAGWAPWTILAIGALFVVRWRKPNLSSLWEKVKARIASADPLNLFVWTAFIVVLVFYCLPSSKRSVYLLPCYPFMAVLLAYLVEWLSVVGRRRVLRFYVWFMAVVSVVLTAVFFVVRAGAVPTTVFGGKHADENAAMLLALQDGEMGFWQWLLVLLPLVAAAASLYIIYNKTLRTRLQWLSTAAVLPVVVVLMALDGVYQPAVLRTKSLLPMAQTIDRQFPDQPLYSYISKPMMHFFGANFYLGDRIDAFYNPRRAVDGDLQKSRPEQGILIIPDSDRDEFFSKNKDYQFVSVMNSQGRVSELRDKIYFYKFKRLSTK